MHRTIWPLHSDSADFACRINCASIEGVRIKRPAMKTQEAFETPKTMHSLDNPIWNSLSTLHTHFAEGDELAKRYPPEVTLLAAMAEPTAEAFASLAKTLRRAGAALFLDQPPQIPAGWITVHASPLVQMVCETPNLAQEGFPAEKLTPADVPEMVALAELTKPGPR